MQVFIAQVINGLSLGSIYVLLVTGFNLLLLVAMIIHFSYPRWWCSPCTSPGWCSSSRAATSSWASPRASHPPSPSTSSPRPLFQKVMQKRGEVDINSTMVLSMGIGMIITDVLSHTFNKGLPIAFPDQLAGATAARSRSA